MTTVMIQMTKLAVLTMVPVTGDAAESAYITF